MALNQGILHYANIASDGRFTLSRQAGVAPGQVTANFIMGASLPAFGDVRVSFGSQSIRLPNCRLRRRVIDAGSGRGRMQQVLLEDRRWQWAFAKPLYGYYNHYEKGIKVTTSTNIRSCRALATIILDWLGEQRFDVSALPDDFFPVVMWDGEDCPAALEALVDAVGCQVVLQWDDTIKIVKRGVGIAAPNDDRVMEFTYVSEPVVIPEYLIVEAGATRFQADLPLEPIGYEPDTKEIRNVDDLSYKPAGGWGAEAPGMFYGVTDPKLRDLAQSCVWKMFRPRLPVSLRVNAGIALQRQYVATIESDQLYRILPLESQQLDVYRDTATDRLKDAQIVGYFCDQHQGFKNNQDIPFGLTHDEKMLILLTDVEERDLIYTGYGRGGEMPFSIDAEQGIIRTSEPLYYLEKDLDGNTTGVSEPKVCLRTSFPIRDPDWRSPYRQQFVFHVGGQRGIVKTLRVDELPNEHGYPGMKNWSPSGPPDFEQQCYFYAQRWLNQFYDGPSATIPMKGFALDIDVDGAVRSVTFSRDEAGRSTTMVEWHTERAEVRPTYAELFDKRTVNDVVKKFREANSARARSNGKRNAGAGFSQGGGFGS